MVEINNKTKIKIDEKKLKQVTEKFLKNHKQGKKDVSLAFIGNQKMKELNKSCRKIDRTTDILAFPGEDNFFGEIIISLPQIRLQAKKSFKHELVFVLVHGLLHLLGHEDKTEKERVKMIKLGEEFLKTFNF